ncbi:MAG: AMP-binding protein [Eubacteriales bacterium]|nr:AMP-binding protein [Eubacteriales bacterium]
MKNGPLYEVRKIKDLKDMLSQSAELYANDTAFLVKDPRALGDAAAVAEAEGAINANNKDGNNATPAKDKSLPYLPVTYKKYSEDVDAFGTYLMNQGLQSARVAILAETRYEWYISYMSTVNGAGIVVPLDKELPVAEISSLLNRAHADVLIYAGSKRKEVDAIRDQLPEMKIIISMDEPVEGSGDLYFWNCLTEGYKLLGQGDKTFVDAVIDAETLGILLFTSGTTAISKAVMLSHRNICINLQAMCSMLYIGPDDVFLSVLPLHHTYECTCGFLCPIYRGCTVAVCEGLRHITKNMQESKVTIMLVVPLMMELFYKRIMKAATSTPEMAKKFRMGLKISGLLRKIGVDKRRKLFARVHDNFGGHLRLLIAGGAAIDPSVLSGMQDLGIHCVQGYGLTECAPILALNRDAYYKNESAGLPLPGVDVKIIDKDENGIGEIIGKGPNVMLGYYEDEEATAEAIDKDGYFHTGDLGYLDKDNFVIITGRKKNVIVTNNGKNIYPEEIEFLLLQHDLIAECLVSSASDSDGKETMIQAEIFPSEEKVNELFGAISLDDDRVRAEIEKIIREVNHSLATYKYVKRFELRTTEFEKTTSKKIKRKY